MIHSVKFSISSNQMGEFFKLSWLLGLSEHSMCTASLYFL